jgi:hypothetical protein
LGLRDWITRVFRTGPDDESAAVEEYHLPDPGAEDLREHPAPSFFGGFESPGKDELDLPSDD